jgi:hypothetical protein
MIAFNIAQDNNGQATFAVPFADHINVQTLAPTVAETVTIPSGARYVVFSSTADFYARINATATIPVGDVTNGSGSEMNPSIRQLKDVTSLSVISPSACTITMAFYS